MINVAVSGFAGRISDVGTKFHVSSIPDLFEQRFGKTAKVVLGCLIAFTMMGTVASQVTATATIINMLGGGQKAWITVCAVYSIVAFFMLLFCYKGCQERFHTDAAKEAEAMPFAQRLKATLKNKYFIVLTLTMMAVALYQNVNGTVATYYAQYLLNNVEIMGVMQSFENIP